MFAFDACFDELEKISAVSDEEARRSLDRLDQLEKSKPTGSQVARYGGLGAGAGALGHVVSRAIEGGERSVTRRSALGAAAAGAIGMGGVPLVRGALDRHAEKKTLKSYLHQGEEKVGRRLWGMPPRQLHPDPNCAVCAAKMSAQAEKDKVAASAPTRGNFMMASDIPSFRAPRLDVAIQKDGAFEDTKKGTEKDSDSIGLTTYSPGDFRPVNINAKHAGYFKLEGDAVIETDKHGKSLGKGPVNKEAMLSMSTEKLAEFVAELREMRKQAIAGLTPASQLEKTTQVGAPKASAPPGPSIADQVKPRGPKFGIGLPGAFKTHIG